MKRWMIVLGMVVTLSLGVTFTYAQGPDMGPDMKHSMGPGPRGMHEHGGMGKDSLLTPEQKAKIQELRNKFIEETAQLKGALLTKRLELQSLWSNPKAEGKAILDKERELRDILNRLGDKVVQFKLEARKFLTPEQIAAFGQHFGKDFGFGGEHMMEPGPGMDRCQGR